LHVLKRLAAWLAGGIAAAVLALALAWVLFVPAADWLAHHDVGSAKGPLLQTARDDARGRLLTLAAGLFAAGALIFTARNFTLSREGQVTDRYTKAIEQLGSDKLDVRLGGIYALERIARDSARDHPTVLEVLTAFIREHSRDPNAGRHWHRLADRTGGPRSRLYSWLVPEDRGRERSIRPDVQAAITVIGQRDAKRDIRLINLSRANLTGANLYRANLGGANLTGANLRGAFIASADLHGADLAAADLRDADLMFTDFTGASLVAADLRRADIQDANFSGANLAIAKWPTDAPAPEGWKLETGSGRLKAAGTDSGPAEPN
jgi:Pentapeptide repeats (8 copies)